MNPSSRNPDRPLAFLMALAVGFVFATLFATEASARPRQQNIDVTFTELEAELVRGKLRVAYTVDGRDWRRIENLHIRPTLNLYTPTRPGQFEFVYALPLNHRSGVIMFPHDVAPDRGRFVELRVSGSRNHTKVTSTSYASQRGSRVRVPLTRAHRDGHGHRWNDVSVIEACSANTSWSGDLEQCIQKAKGLGHGAPAIVNACGGASSWSGDFLACLDLSKGLGANEPATINACDAATSWSGDFKECLGAAAAYRGDAAPTVKACSEATSWSGDFKACMDDAKPLGRRAPAVVNACDAATSWSGEFQRCLVAARRG